MRNTLRRQALALLVKEATHFANLPVDLYCLGTKGSGLTNKPGCRINLAGRTDCDKQVAGSQLPLDQITAAQQEAASQGLSPPLSPHAGQALEPS